MATFNIDGTKVTWPDGASGLVRQDGQALRDTANQRHAFVGYLKVELQGAAPIRGTLRISAEALEQIEHKYGEQTSERIGRAFAERLQATGLPDGFGLKVFFQEGVTIDDVELVDVGPDGR